MLRVLHLIYDDPANPWVAGGGAVRVRELYRRLATRLQSVVVATGNYPGAGDETIDGIRYLRLGARKPYALSRLTYAVRAGRLLDAGDYDVAVFDFSTYVPLAVPTNRPVGYTVHHITGHSAVERWGTLLGRVVAAQEARRLRAVCYFSATSGATEEQLRRIVGAEAKITRIAAGVPDELFTLPRAEAGYLLYFGRLDWFQKGLDTLLEATAILSSSRGGVLLKIAGRGKDAGRVIEAAERLGITAHVQMLGPVGDADRNRLLSGALALLMPSRFEGFGMVAAEAMAAGVPVVAADSGSLPEVVDPPAGGVIVPAGDAAALASATASLLDDAAARANFTRSARRSAERFRWDAIADQHLNFLNMIRLDHSRRVATEEGE